MAWAQGRFGLTSGFSTALVLCLVRIRYDTHGLWYSPTSLDRLPTVMVRSDTSRTSLSALRATRAVSLEGEFWASLRKRDQVREADGLFMITLTFDDLVQLVQLELFRSAS
jgi:hypothetical protein